jgi:broad specificity phosphatase PhoE
MDSVRSFTSDLRRAVETAEIAFRETSLPVHIDQRLRECNYGDLNGQSRVTVDAERVRRLERPFPGGESWRQATARAAQGLEKLCADHAGERVLLIGHVATHWACERICRGATLDELASRPFAWQPGWEYVVPCARLDR